MLRLKLLRPVATRTAGTAGAAPPATAVAARPGLRTRAHAALEHTVYGAAALPLGPLGAFSTKLGEGGIGEPTDPVTTTAWIGGGVLCAATALVAFGAVRAVRLYRSLSWMPDERFVTLPAWEQAVARYLAPGRYTNVGDVPDAVAAYYRTHHTGTADLHTLAEARRVADRLEAKGAPLTTAEAGDALCAYFAVQYIVEEQRLKGPGVIDAIELLARLGALDGFVYAHGRMQSAGVTNDAAKAFSSALGLAHHVVAAQQAPELALHFLARGLRNVARCAEWCATHDDAATAVIGMTRLEAAYSQLTEKVYLLEKPHAQVRESDRAEYLQAAQEAQAQVKALCNAQLRRLLAHATSSVDAALCVAERMDAPWLDVPLQAWHCYLQIGERHQSMNISMDLSNRLRDLVAAEVRALERLAESRTGVETIQGREQSVAELQAAGDVGEKVYRQVAGLFFPDGDAPQNLTEFARRLAEQRVAVERERAALDARVDTLQPFLDKFVVPLVEAQRELAASQAAAFTNARAILRSLGAVALRSPWHANGRYRAALAALRATNPELIDGALADYEDIAAFAAEMATPAAPDTAAAESPSEPGAAA